MRSLFNRISAAPPLTSVADNVLTLETAAGAAFEPQTEARFLSPSVSNASGEKKVLFFEMLVLGAQLADLVEQTHFQCLLIERDRSRVLFWEVLYTTTL